MSLVTENEIITQIIKDGAATAMGLEQIISLEVSEWKNSKKRELMLKGEEYYRNRTDILERERTTIGASGARETVQNLANNKLVNGFFRKLVDQKVGYLLSKPMGIQTQKKEYLDLLEKFLNKSMLRTIQNIGKEAIKKGIAWLHVYYNESGNLSFMPIPSEQIIPLWRDAAHTDLQAVIRYYEVEAFEGTAKKTIQKVEWWDTNGVHRYIVQAGGQYGLIPDVEVGEAGSHFGVTQQDEKGEKRILPVNWERVPFVAFKYNEEEQSLLDLIKSLIDDYDAKKSDNANNLEDLPNSIYVVKDYDGTDAAEFRKNISVYRVVFTQGEGGVDTISLEINTEAYKNHMEQNRKDIYEFGRGVDTESDKLGSSPSGISLKFLYADLDMDCNIIETEFQASLEQLRWFMDVHIANTTGKDYSKETLDFIFNRDILINETDVITNCKNSEGIISKRTIVANHPWSTNLQDEIDQLKKEQEEDLERFNDYSEFRLGENEGRQGAGGDGK